MTLADTLRSLAQPAQTRRLIQLCTALPEAALVVESFTGEEALSTPGWFDITCLSTSAHWPLVQLVDQEVTLRLLLADGGYRHFHGMVEQAWQLGADGGLARYRLRLVPWLHALSLREDCYVFQDQSVRDVIASVFAEYPHARYRFELSEPGPVKSLCTQFNESDLDFVHRLLAEQGWSYRIEHDQQSQVTEAAVQAHHTVVIFDRQTVLPEGAQSSIRFHQNALTERTDAIDVFIENVIPVSTLVTLHSFDDRALRSHVGTASVDLSNLLGTLIPQLETFIEASPGLYRTSDEATAAARLVQDALALKAHTFNGRSGVRALAAGTRFTLTQHDVFDQQSFTVTRVQHYARNNLGSQLAQLLGKETFKDGTYRNTFDALPAAVPVVLPAQWTTRAQRDLWIGPMARPRHADLDTALVVGVEGEALTTTREHRVKVQFAWQRGQRPNAGGLSLDNAFDTDGRAPGDETAGIWVRVTEPVAGPNFGSVFVPRIGTEVVVQYLNGDIDCPVITGQLYNGQDLPPFSAGQDSAANHPGVLKGMHTQGLNDDSAWNQWQSDATPGQLRTRLGSSLARSELNLGHLIDQPPGTAQRGAYRGQGAELRTDGWLVTRMGEGFLISSTARPGSLHSAQGTQMDTHEGVSQLKGGQDLQQRLQQAATNAQALSPTTISERLQHGLNTLDSEQEGRYTQPLNGQATTQPSGDPVSRFAEPHLVIDSSDDRLDATPASHVQYAAGHLIHLTQQHRHDSSAYTHAHVSGKASSLFAQDGGLQFIAAQGPVSLQAHTGALDALSQDALTVTSVNGEIEIKAPNQIILQAGDTRIELNGPNVTFSTSGEVQLKGNQKLIGKHLSGGTELPTLPQGTVIVPKSEGVPAMLLPHDEQFMLVDESGSPLPHMPYKITTTSGMIHRGVTDLEGRTQRVDTNSAQKLKVEPDLDAEKLKDIYDEQIQFTNANGALLKQVHYALYLDNGQTVTGVTDDEGKTKRVVTDTSATITRAELLADSPCCPTHGDSAASQSAALQVPVNIPTNTQNVGSSTQVVSTPEGQSRGLTSGEISIAQLVFGSSVDYSKVKIHNGEYLWFGMQPDDTAMTPNGEMYFNPERFKEDFSKAGEYGDQLWFMHEMVHVWQYQLGYPVKWRGALRVGLSYNYTLSADKKLSDYNMEAQGNLISDYWAHKAYGSQPPAVWETKHLGDVALYELVLKEFINNPADMGNLP